MKIIVTRDSVAMGDDADAPHRVEVDDNDKGIRGLIHSLQKIDYIPEIYGGKATWAIIGFNPICVIAQEWRKPKYLLNEDVLYSSEIKATMGKLKIAYFAQQDPNAVYEVLSQYRCVT